MSRENPRDIASVIHTKAGIHAFAVLAGGGADGTLKVGEVIDRAAMPHGKSPALSAEICIAVLAVLASTETCIISTIKVEHDTDSGFSTPTDLKTFTETLTVTDAVAGEKGELRLAIDLSSAKQFIRIELTPTMSAGATDTADIFCSLAFGGFPVVAVA